MFSVLVIVFILIHINTECVSLFINFWEVLQNTISYLYFALKNLILVLKCRHGFQISVFLCIMFLLNNIFRTRMWTRICVHGAPLCMDFLFCSTFQRLPLWPDIQRGHNFLQIPLLKSHFLFCRSGVLSGFLKSGFSKSG